MKPKAGAALLFLFLYAKVVVDAIHSLGAAALSVAVILRQLTALTFGSVP